MAAGSEDDRGPTQLRLQPIEPVPTVHPRPAELAVEAIDSGPSGLEVGGWVLFGLGGASFVAGVVTGILALEQSRQLDAGCVDALCPPEFHSGVDAFYAYRTASTATLAAAGALVLPGVALLLVAAEPDGGAAEPSTAAASPHRRPVPIRTLRLIVRPFGVELAAVL